MTRAAPRREDHGFTLLELLIALAIVAILAVIQVAPFQRALVSRDRAEAAMGRATAARLTLQRIAEELSGAVSLRGERFRFEALDRSVDRPSSELAFTTTAARRLRSGPQDPVETVRYRLEPGASDEAGALLVKQLQASVAPSASDPQEAVVLDGVEAFRVRVLPRAGEWTETWRGPASGKPEDLPRAVALELVLADGTDVPPVYRLVVDLPLGARS